MSKYRKPARTGTGLSVRGKTISNPIPFPEDDEFPIRTPGAGIALPLGSDAENQIRIRESVAAQLENTSHETGIAVSDFIDPSPAPQVAPMPSQPTPDVPMRRSNQPPQVRNSVASRTTGSSAGPQRKKSTMRAVFGRLFGKKRKGSGSSSPAKPGPNELRAGQHRSDPTALNRSPPASSQKRSASLPINEFNRALRSHSIVADDFPLRDSAENNTNRGSIPVEGQRRSRRATTPSRLWTPTKTPGYVDWTGLSPRPASTHVRGSKAISDAVADATIGTAVTSSSHPNRRSRSLGELRDVMSGTTRRRRSDEIRYWRQSYDPGVLSPMSSNKAEADEPILVEDPRDIEPQEQPQPFMFEMAGMKITQAANLETRVQRLEERVMQMERMVGSRNYHQDSMQFQDSPRRGSTSKRSTSITRPQTDNSDISLPRHRYREAAQPRSSQIQDSLPPPLPTGSQNRSSSYGSGSRPSTISTHNSYHPSFDAFPVSTNNPSEAPPQSQTQVPATNYARPLSTSTTIRGVPSSSPTYTKDSTLTGEHYTALTNMILAEQQARHELENVVQSLQRQLRTYLSTHSHSHHNNPSYPTPGSDATNPNQDPLHLSTRYTSHFSPDEDSDTEERYLHTNPHDPDPDHDADEVFQTPNEGTGQFGDEIFGDAGRGGYMKDDDEDVENYEPYEKGVGERDDEKRRSAPRTLSLSQITMGRGALHSVNF